MKNKECHVLKNFEKSFRSEERKALVHSVNPKLDKRRISNFFLKVRRDPNINLLPFILTRLTTGPGTEAPLDASLQFQSIQNRVHRLLHHLKKR